LAGAGAALVIGILLFRAPLAAGLSGSAAPGAPNVEMNCAPNQQALVRQTTVRGEAQFTVNCVGVPAASAARSTASTGSTSSYRRPAPAPAARVVPAAPTRSWKKTALVIGGSTGAGAGIGAAVGGKKGALIGAAIGGGASAIYEAIKRR
jgi:hypothetical protein